MGIWSHFSTNSIDSTIVIKIKQEKINESVSEVIGKKERRR
jgi:hypothetical protein